MIILNQKTMNDPNKSEQLDNIIDSGFSINGAVYKETNKRIIESDSQRFAIPKSGKYNFKDIPLADPRVWALFARGDTLGCFQLEKQLGQDWSKKAKPQSIEELGVLVSILRPGPLESGMSEQYVKCKHGKEDVSYIHPALEHILGDTYGCLIYQEQAMKIAVDLAGFSPVQADNLRKAIGKKKPEEMVKVKKMFMEEAAKKGLISVKEAEEIFGWIEKSVRYSFNKSHAISYALISYLSAYQKVHFPTEFYTAWLTYSDWKPDPKEEVYNLVQNARLNNVTINPPDVRRKNVDFEIVSDRQIIFGLSHIRGVGSKAIENIKELSNEELSTFQGFLKAAKKIRRNVSESLIKSGACDCYDKSRILMLRHVHAILGRGEKDTFEIPPEARPLTPKEYQYVMSKIDELGIHGALYSLIENGKCVKKRVPTIEAKIKYITELEPDTNRRKSIWEKLYLGLNLTCSAADDIEYTERNIKTCREVHKVENRSKVTMHVVIDGIRMRKTGDKSRNPGLDFCYLSVSDNTGALANVVCWPEVYDKVKGELVEDTVASILAKKESWNGRDQIVVESIQIID